MHVFIVGNTVIAFFVGFFFVAVVIKFKRIRAAQADAEEKAKAAKAGK